MPQSCFPYRRSIAPALGVILALALIETVVVHIVAAALWGRLVAVLLGVLDLGLVLWLLMLLHAIRARPVTLADGVLTMRLGNLRVIPIPVGQIAGARGSWDAGALKRRDVANLALATWPNIVLDLSESVVVRGRPIRTVAHKLDDPGALLAVLKLGRRG